MLLSTYIKNCCTIEELARRCTIILYHRWWRNRLKNDVTLVVIIKLTVSYFFLYCLENSEFFFFCCNFPALLLWSSRKSHLLWRAFRFSLAGRRFHACDVTMAGRTMTSSAAVGWWIFCKKITFSNNENFSQIT